MKRNGLDAIFVCAFTAAPETFLIVGALIITDWRMIAIHKLSPCLPESQVFARWLAISNLLKNAPTLCVSTINHRVDHGVTPPSLSRSSMIVSNTGPILLPSIETRTGTSNSTGMVVRSGMFAASAIGKRVPGGRTTSAGAL